MTKAYYFDMDGVIANFHKEPFKYTNAISREWIANLEPFMENINLMRKLILANEIVYILTKAASEDAKLGKIDFLKKYVPEFDFDKFICIVGSGKKIDYIQEDGMLIDDDIKNIRQWEKAGQKVYFVETKGKSIEL